MNPLAECLHDCAVALSSPSGGSHPSVFATVDRSLSRLYSHRLFTILTVVNEGREVERVYSSNTEAYPLLGRKPMGPTPWGEHVIQRKMSWHGRTITDLRWAFPDFETIVSLGCGSCINIPIVVHGNILGTMNMLGSENIFSDAVVAELSVFSSVVAAEMVVNSI